MMPDVAEMLETRSRLVCMIVYAESMVDIDVFLTAYSNAIKHFAVICHDKDTKDDGTLKEKHYHLCLNLRSDYELCKVLEWVKGITHQNAMIQVLASPQRMYWYMLHKGRNDKHQYSEDEIYTDDPLFWISKDEKSVSLLNAIIDGQNPAALAFKYGREYILNHKAYEEVAVIIRSYYREQDAVDKMES